MRTTPEKLHRRIAEQTYHLVHVVTVVVTSFLTVTVEQILSLDHLPELVRLARYTRTEQRGRTYQAGSVPDIYSMGPSGRHQYFGGLVDFGLYVRVGMVGSDASFPEVAKYGRSVRMTMRLPERSGGI